MDGDGEGDGVNGVFINDENRVQLESEREWSLDEVKKALSLLRWQRDRLDNQVSYLPFYPSFLHPFI